MDDRLVGEPAVHVGLGDGKRLVNPLMHDEAGDVAGQCDRAQVVLTEPPWWLGPLQVIEVVTDRRWVPVEQRDGLVVSAVGHPPGHPAALALVGEGVVTVVEDGVQVGDGRLPTVDADRGSAEPFVEVIGVNGLVRRDYGDLLLGARNQRLR